MRNLSIRKRVALAATIAALFTLLFIALVLTYLFPNYTPDSLSFLITYHFEFMIFMVGLGVLCGASIFYLMREEVNTIKIESKLNAELALGLLEPNERKAIEILVKNGGNATQAEVARIGQISRLRAHRVSKSLERRGLVTLEKNGKLVELKLERNVLDALKAG